MDALHDVSNLDAILTAAATVLLAVTALASFGGIWLVARYGFPWLDRVHDRLTSRRVR